ncbi:MAG TPA: hypothetical protein VE913_01690 [Longimicrobium sp.]|nr:hypothetical protein [Longimicrobium sp.]
MREYRYQGFVAGGEMVATAYCVIPGTERAVRHMDRFIGVKRAAASGDLGGVTIMGCVVDGMCEVDGITARGCIGGGDWPDCNGIMQPEDIPQCSAFGECGDDGWAPTPAPNGPDGPPPGLPGDVDGDGDTLDDGAGAYALCVAVKLGPGGWSAIIGSGVGAYGLWIAQSDVRESKRQYDEYHEMMGSPYGGNSWNFSTDELYRLRYEDALVARNFVAAALALTLGAAGWEVTKAMIECAPALAAPVP